MAAIQPGSLPAEELVNGFRLRFHHYAAQVQAVVSQNTDSTVLERIKEDLEEFMRLTEQYGHVLHNDELSALQQHVQTMLQDIITACHAAEETSQYGRPELVTYVPSGRPGRPRIHIDRDWLAWAVHHRTTSGIAKFLGVSRYVVRNAILEYGLKEPGTAPFPSISEDDDMEEVELEATDRGDIGLLGEAGRDTLLDPITVSSHEDAPNGARDDLPSHPSDTEQGDPPEGVHTGFRPIESSGPLSVVSDHDLDETILRLRSHYRRAGVTMLDGMLRRLGLPVGRERIRQSLLRIDPVQRVFDRIRIRRRKYQVAGPNALWHHDGQHGLIRWRIVIHGFIDGYSRLITGLRASNNNRAETVLDLFLEASGRYRIPHRLRGDHGVENLLVAEFMRRHFPGRRGAYIWGRSIHNIRIERLWVDVTVAIGAKWYDFFITLEVSHGLDRDNLAHIWLLHFIFLPLINQELSFFSLGWNSHKMQFRDGPNRSPEDMFGFDMAVYGVRGVSLSEELSDEELEVYGVDWEGLESDDLLASRDRNNGEEDPTTWLGHEGLPEHLNRVDVDPLDAPSCISPFDVASLNTLLSTFPPTQFDDASLAGHWDYFLAYVRLGYSDVF